MSSSPIPTLPWRLAAGVGAAVVLGASGGDAFAGAALVGLALGPWPGAAAGLAAAATVARWGTADLAVVAGDQGVLGPAVATGPVLAALSSVLAALALLTGAVASSPADRRVVAVLTGGLGAGVLACGPAPTSLVDGGLRAAGAVVGLALAWLLTAAGRPSRLPAWVGAAVGVGAVVAAIAAP